MCELADIAKTVADEFDDLARQLRQGAGHELRAEAAEDEELTELQRLRHLGLAEAARAAMHRGDRVTAYVAGLSLTRPIVGVGDDYLTMEDDDRYIDVRLIDAVLTVEPRPAGGASGRPAAATFRARVAEHEQERASVEVVSRDGTRWSGRIEVVGVDHLAMAGADGRRAYVPLGSVVVLFSRFPPRRV